MVMFIFHIFRIEVVGGVGVLAGQSYAIQVTPHGNLMTPHRTSFNVKAGCVSFFWYAGFCHLIFWYGRFEGLEMLWGMEDLRFFSWREALYIGWSQEHNSLIF